MQKFLVTGAGGFIGHHLVKYLKEKGFWVRGVDQYLPAFEKSSADEFLIRDLREFGNCQESCQGVDYVFQLAADMGGIGFITAHHAIVMRHNALINLHMLEAARRNEVKKYLYTSSACIYPQYLQKDVEVTPLREDQAYPADAEPGYGWEKLFSELANIYFRKDFGLNTYVVRFHNIFGPIGTYQGGREKAPAAICRKIALAKDGDEIDIWGDGEQTRSFCYIDDCIEGLYRTIQSDYHEPLNLGQDRLITINELVDMVAKIAGKQIIKRHDLTKPQGVRGRNSDNNLLRKVLRWEPQISLEKGLALTYQWISSELQKQDIHQ